MMQIRCPHCSFDLSVPESAIGTSMPCPKCEQTIAVQAEHAASRTSEMPVNRSRARLWPIALHAGGYALLTAVSLAGWFMPRGPEMVGPAYVRNQYHDVVTANRIQLVERSERRSHGFRVSQANPIFCGCGWQSKDCGMRCRRQRTSRTDQPSQRRLFGDPLRPRREARERTGHRVNGAVPGRRDRPTLPITNLRRSHRPAFENSLPSAIRPSRFAAEEKDDGRASRLTPEDVAASSPELRSN
jgi:hypothetical protein